EQLIKTVRIDLALKLNATIFDFRRDRPTVVSIERLEPPAVEHAKINSAVRRALHSAGTTRFHRAERIVQPEIDALDEPARYVAIVILKKHHAVFEAGFPAEFVDFLN